MADSIRERILQNWETTLRGISIANGYNNDIDLVDRYKVRGMDQSKNVILQIKRGSDDDVSDESGSLGVVTKELEINTLIQFRNEPPPSDALINSIEQDVYRAVNIDIYRGGLALRTDLVSSPEIEPDEDGGQAEKAIVYRVRYRHLIGDESLQ